MDLERRADAEQQRGGRGERLRASERALGQQLAEQHDVRLQRLAAVAAGDAVGGGGEPLPHRLELVGAPQARHEDVAIEPCTSTSSRVPAAACRPSMFCVSTAARRPAARARRGRGGRRWAACRAGSRSARRRTPRSATGSRRKARMCATSIGSTFAHRPVCGRAEVRDAGRHGDARAGEGHDGPARADQRGELRGRSAHAPLKRGGAPAEEGGDALARVLGGEHGAERLALGRKPLVEVAVVGDALDLLDRQRRLAGELAAPARARRRTARGRPRRG